MRPLYWNRRAPVSRRIKVRIPLRNESIELTYLDSSLPAWAEPVLRSLPDRWGETPGWDGFQPPEITPLADGGVQAEWHRRQQDLEIVVPADDEPSYYLFHHVTGEEEEGPFEQHEIRIRDLIGGLS